jgi:hypothetical protein
MITINIRLDTELKPQLQSMLPASQDNNFGEIHRANDDSYLYICAFTGQLAKYYPDAFEYLEH